MKSQTLSVAGVHGNTIVYDVHRPESGPVGVVVLAHGLGEHAARYLHLAARLTDVGYVVVAPDHAGHGRSSGKRLGVTDFDDFIADLHTVIGNIDRVDGPTFLLGHSMGGAIALKYALDHPEALDGLILSGPALMPGADLPPVLVKLAPILGKVAPWLPSAALPASGVSRDPKVVAAYEADPLVWHGKIPAGLGGTLIATMGTFPDRLPQLTMPVLAMHGGADTLANPDGTRMLGRRAGGDDVTVTIFDGLYHEIFNEPEQDEVITTVVDWLEKHRTAQS
ncbi:alpha/beta hydrolase [Gordonia hydrophobica]|uniref:Lysophospholipase n=1 Tax=Gordonia hydrophobica TaxID=40516 RepID=A0ABZ2U2U4_9ACTN|nr:alpha/beta hydrolase [Gordonia hydrophobica]MBM7369026.1 alpha-beta hydrolase superfamily lysophospholipase [Gordonia hydrophobica]